MSSSSGLQDLQEDLQAVAATRIDPLIFLFAVILGASTIVLLKSGLVSIPHANMLGILLPVMVMVLYACMVTLIPRTRLRMDQAGDNLYYLGFTYTLCSLATTLYRFHTAEGTADYIVSNFGIALATTIAGVVCRVLLHQMRDDPLELEREARSELTDGVNRLRSEIDQTVREFNHFSRTLRQSSQEAIEGQGKLVLQSLDESTKQYAAVAARALGYLEGSLVDFQRCASELNGSSERIAVALVGLSGRIDNIETPNDLVSTKLTPIFHKLAEAAEQAAGRVTSERQRNQTAIKLMGQLDILASNLDSVSGKMAHRDDQVATAIQQAVATSENAANMIQRIGVWTDKFAESESKQTEVLATVTSLIDAAKERDLSRDELLSQALSKVISAVDGYESRFDKLLKTHSELFENELQHAERAFLRLSGTLSQGATMLATELGKKGNS